MRLPNAPLEAEVQRLGSAQLSMLNGFYGAPAAARREQRRLETQTRALAARHPDDPRAATLWAYNEKNAVILDHDAEISAGIKVVDERLDEARWRFLHALWLDPLDAEALNGLGTIAWFGHDLDSAEFFVRAALRRIPNYGAAQHDLALILALKKKSRDPKPRPALRQRRFARREQLAARTLGVRPAVDRRRGAPGGDARRWRGRGSISSRRGLSRPFTIRPIWSNRRSLNSRPVRSPPSRPGQGAPPRRFGPQD
jgi:tetratricopeptide (TPR) repeat protein